MPLKPSHVGDSYTLPSLAEMHPSWDAALAPSGPQLLCADPGEIIPRRFRCYDADLLLIAAHWVPHLTSIDCLSEVEVLLPWIPNSTCQMNNPGFDSHISWTFTSQTSTVCFALRILPGDSSLNAKHSIVFPAQTSKIFPHFSPKPHGQVQCPACSNWYLLLW